MRRPQELAADEALMAGMVQLTSIFESIASLKIAHIKDQVLRSKQFFEELWHIYTQIRADDLFRYGRSESHKVIPKQLLVVITGEGGFSGDIDEKLIEIMLQAYEPERQDIIVVGHHGAIQLAQRSIAFKRYYKLPEHEENINTLPIIQEVQQYKSTTVYYQTYVSLMVQDVKYISLGAAIVNQGKNAVKGRDIISEKTYIFEPNTYELLTHLERSMLQIAISQVILESKLAQYASRFRAMNEAHSKADESFHNVHLLYNRAKRAFKDERLKEIINGLRKAKV